MSTLDLRSLARALGGVVSGRQVLAPGLGHSPQDRSLAIRPDPQAPGGFIVHSFSGDDPLEAKDYVRRKLGLSHNREPLRAVSSRVSAVVETESSSAKTINAMRIWGEAQHPRGTPVEPYLTRPRSEGRRGVIWPDDAAGRAIRYHPACPFGGTRTPAMVCLVRDIRTNEPRAIHRTALTLDGLKTTIGGYDRLTLAPTAGGAIKFTPDEDVTTCLGIGEGVETTLSLRNRPVFGPSPVWSLISAGGIDALPVLPGIECLWIAVDHDRAGIEASDSCAKRWCNAGRDAFLLTHKTKGLDLNDIPKGEVRHG